MSRLDVRGWSIEEKYKLIYPLLLPGEQVKVIDDTVCKDIIPERYYVTTYGRAFSMFANGNINEMSIEKIGKSIGQRIMMQDINGNAIRKSIYRLVLMVFNPVENMENLEVSHIDGNPANNHLDNLAWRSGSYLNYIQDPHNPFIDFSGLLQPGEVVVPISDWLVPNIRPIYFVSNIGNIYTISGNCNKPISELRKSITNKGYYRVTLYFNDGTNKHFSVHRLVMMAFRYRPDFERLSVNHKDCNPLNNYIDLYNPNNDNLEWCTISYNAQYMISLDRGANQLSPETVIKIRKLLNEGFTVKEVASLYNVTLDCIYGIRNGKTYKLVTEEE